MKPAQTCYMLPEITAKLRSTWHSITTNIQFNRQTQPIILVYYCVCDRLRSNRTMYSEQWDNKCLLQNITFNWNIKFDVRFINWIWKQCGFEWTLHINYYVELIECQNRHGWWPFNGLSIQPLAVSSMFSIGNQNRHIEAIRRSCCTPVGSFILVV